MPIRDIFFYGCACYHPYYDTAFNQYLYQVWSGQYKVLILPVFRAKKIIEASTIFFPESFLHSSRCKLIVSIVTSG